MNTVNTVMSTISSVLMAPVRAWSPLLTLLIISAVCGVVMTVVFKYTSNQKRLKEVAARSKAQLLCMRIFKDDIKVALVCQKDLLKYIGLRLWYSLLPMVVLIIPFVVILTQLAMWYEWRPLRAGESVVAAVHIDPAAWSEYEDDVTLRVPSGVTIETPRLRDAGEHAIYWRLRVDEPVDEQLEFNVGYYVCEKTVRSTPDGTGMGAVSPRRPGASFVDRLLYPREPGFASDWPVLGVDVRYPGRSTPVFGLDIPWWLTFFIVAMIAALIARPFLKVTF